MILEQKYLPSPQVKVKNLLIVLLLVIQVFGFFYYVDFFLVNGYLPSPFVYDKSDTFMDLFNTMYWVYDDGRYSEWHSVYPPLNFLILRLLNFVFDGSSYGDPLYFREDSANVIIGFVFIYLLMPILLLNTRLWKGYSLTDKSIIYVIVIFSTPMLFALERGNLIIFAPILLSLALSSSGFLRSLSIGLLINLKPYFVLIMIYYLIKRDVVGFKNTTIIAGVIFLVTGLILDNHFYLFFSNLLGFSQEETLFSLREVMSMPSSISAISYALKDTNGFAFASSFQNIKTLLLIMDSIDAVKWAVIIFGILSLIKNYSLVKDAEVIFLLTIVISNLGVWVGGYTLILYMAFIPILHYMRWRVIYLLILILIAIPLDIIALVENTIGFQNSYLSDSRVMIDWTLGLGSILRPVANLFLLLVFAFEIYLRSNDAQSKI